MPYITGDDKRKLRFEHNQLPETCGELNYCITCLVRDYVKYQKVKRGKLSYQILNDVVGAIEGAKLEFVRRIVNPYEDEKIRQNGDVY